jgi:hypothetical protein
MPQRASLGLLVVLLLNAPAVALTAQEKAATCKFGADDQKLTGAARKAFMTKCMADDKTAAPTSTPAPKPQ